MIPGRTYTPLECAQVAWRRRATVVLPLLVCLLIGATVAVVVPKRYRSETVILVVPQSVPESYVRSTITAGIEDRLQTITQQIMSRTRLERIIQEFDLYAEERRTMLMTDVVIAMRKDISVEIIRDGQRQGDASFTVAYESKEPETARRVTERLASLFIDENLRDREVLVEGTNAFLETQLGEARQRLIATEKRLEEYRRVHAGQLPSQLPTNLQVIQSLQAELKSLTDSIARDDDRRLMLERLVATQSAPAMTSVVTGDAGGGRMVQDTLPVAQQLDLARSQLAALERRLTPLHPDVSRARREVAQLEEKVASIKVGPPTAEPVVTTAAELAAQARSTEMKAEIESLDRQLAFKRNEEQQLKGRLAQYSQRVEAAPARESELVELTRDYETLQQMYTGLLAKKEESRIATELERRQVGEQFKVLDPASMPATPVSPNLLVIALVAVVGGLGLGAGLTVLLEYRDETLRSREDIGRFLSIPVAAVVPVLRTRRAFSWLRASP